MNGRRKSDRFIVPEIPSNKGHGAPRPAERGEERSLTKGNPSRHDRCRAQHRDHLQQALARVRQAAEKDREVQFTSIWHHVYDPHRLREAYFGLKRMAAPGMDGETWWSYGEDLEENLTDLSERLRRGAYRAKPVRRIYIPKPDGRQRPIGIPVLEDKIVQRSAAEVMGAIYEADFVKFSYAFRPNRHQHNALDAVFVGITQMKVNWVLDADIRGFFDAIDHEWLMKFIGHRISDKRVHRHVKKWLNAGVLEDDQITRSETGTPQGGSISPLLANIYLHYVIDLWVQSWRKNRAKGDVIVVRFADDVVMGFQYRWEADRFLAALKKRLAEFGLSLNDEKTRLIEFGRFAAENRRRRGDRKPQTFDFLGFTHICGKTRHGRFKLLRKTIASRMTRTLHAIKEKLRKRMHSPVNEVGAWLTRVLAGYYQYFAVPDNSRALRNFRQAVVLQWRHVLIRRSQKGRVPWRTFGKLAEALPRPRVLHPYPPQRLRVITRGRSPVR